MKDLETKNKFVELRATGRSFDSIARELAVSKQTLINWSKELALEINNLRTIEMDSLFEKYQLGKKAKLENFGEMLNRLKEGFLRRDLASVSSKDLFKAILKLYTAIEKENSLTLEDFGFGSSPPTTSWL